MLSPKLLLHLEGLAIAVAATIAYHALGASWVWFAVLLLAPDLAMLGYFGGKRTGAAFYNLAHTYTSVGLIWVVGHAAQGAWASPVCLIWLAHIGADRALGFGLKYPSDFKATHLAKA